MRLILGFIFFTILSINCARSREASHITYCKPEEPCWPTPDEWKKLKEQVKGRLLTPESFLKPCQNNPQSQACVLALKNAQNPFFLEEHPEATQSTG